MVTAAFVIDPLDQLNLKKDSTLAMIRAAQMRGWNVNYLEQTNLFYQQDRTWGYVRTLRLSDSFADRLAPDAAGPDWYQAGPSEAIPLDRCDIVFMRKDPPFDMNYIYTTYLLERLEAHGVLVTNRPQSLRDCNEKFFATAFAEFCPPLVITSRADVIRDFQAEHGDLIIKRLDGMGGASVFRVMRGDPNFSVIVETLTRHGREPVMAQRFLPEIADGDKRILLVDGEPVPYALARIPKLGEVRGNLAAGGTGEGRPLTPRDRAIAQGVGPELRRRGLHFVGIDVIGDYLTEVNVTCPTCIRELDAQFSLDIASMLLDTLEDKLKQR
jgi:glutathione synthase